MTSKELKNLNQKAQNSYEKIFDNGYVLITKKGKFIILNANFYTYDDMQNEPGTDVDQTGHFEYGLLQEDLQELNNNTEGFLNKILDGEIPSMNTVSQ